MFESHHQPLLPRSAFVRRQIRYSLIAAGMIVVSLLIGMIGYHGLENLSWIDAFVNASMILGGMGPVDELHTPAGKIFAGLYALYSGLVFLLVSAVMLAPLLHRVLHRFHLESEAGGSKKRES